MSDTMIFLVVGGDETAFSAHEIDANGDDLPVTGDTRIIVGIGQIRIDMTIDQWRTLSAAVDHDIEAIPGARQRMREMRASWAERRVSLIPASVWTPDDARRLTELAAEFPIEVGESVALAELMDSEGLR